MRCKLSEVQRKLIVLLAWSSILANVTSQHTCKMASEALAMQYPSSSIATLLLCTKYYAAACYLLMCDSSSLAWLSYHQGSSVPWTLALSQAGDDLMPPPSDYTISVNMLPQAGVAVEMTEKWHLKGMAGINIIRKHFTLLPSLIRTFAFILTANKYSSISGMHNWPCCLEAAGTIMLVPSHHCQDRATHLPTGTRRWNQPCKELLRLHKIMGYQFWGLGNGRVTCLIDLILISRD